MMTCSKNINFRKREKKTREESHNGTVEKIDLISRQELKEGVLRKDETERETIERVRKFSGV